MGSVLHFRWPTVPTFGGAALQLLVGAVVGVAPLSALLLVAVAFELPYFQGAPLPLQVRTREREREWRLGRTEIETERQGERAAPYPASLTQLSIPTDTAGHALVSGIRGGRGFILRVLQVRHQTLCVCVSSQLLREASA